MRKNEITEENNMFFNYVCELKTTSNMAVSYTHLTLPTN